MTCAKVEDMKICKKCGYEWTPKVAQPKECPQCKARKWNETKN